MKEVVSKKAENRPGPGWQIVVLFLCNCRPKKISGEVLSIIKMQNLLFFWLRGFS